MPRLGVIGTFVWDRIHSLENADGHRAEPFEDWGGIAYSLEAFAAARRDEWTCLPIAKVGADLFGPVVDRVSRIGGVDSVEGLVPVPEQNNRVDLYYSDPTDRCERLQGGVPGWNWQELEPQVSGCDALYVNFIAGWEIDLATAQELRGAFDGPIYCDIHSLLLGMSDTGVRVRRELEEWPEWSRCFDLIQGNEDEIRIVSGGIEDPEDAVRSLVKDGRRAVLSTLGADGAAWAARADGGEIEAGLVEPATGWRASDPTGCGDVWGAACFASFLSGAAVRDAAAFANRLSAAAAARSGTENLAADLSPQTVGNEAS
jgi:sugar/nucleoside kinase (ribokinase family)